MKTAKSSLASESATLQAMILIYCRRNHRAAALCPECAELEKYALQRLARCRFGPEKPNCSRCRVHCYGPAMRARIRAVMKFSGPLMLLEHPILALRHLLKGSRRKPPSRGVGNNQ